jgi:hypothetical protein
MESFKRIMKDLLRDEPKPINANIEAPSTQFQIIQTSLTEANTMAEHADSIATEAMDQADAVDKRVQTFF